MLSRFSIRARLTAWYALTLIAVLGPIAAASYVAMRSSMYRAVDVDLHYRLAGVIDEFLELQPTATLRDLPRDIAQGSTLGVLFRIFDEKGTLLYQSDVLTSHHIADTPPQLAGADIAYRNLGMEGWPVRMAAQKITFRGQPIVVEVAQPIRYHLATIREFALSLSIALPLVVAISALAGYWLSGRALAPVARIIEDARAIDSNHPSQRLSVPPARDELRRLSETLNSMLDRIEVSITRIRQFTADASHELRAPLTLIQTAAEYSLRRERSPAELIDALDKILRESRRTSQLIDHLLLLARADSAQDKFEPAPVTLNLVLQEVLDRARPLAESKSVALAASLGSDVISVNADAGLLHRLFFILLDNAIKYTPEKGSVEISLRCDEHSAFIRVSDTGIGLTREDLPHVFDRFWRADKVRSRELGGAGLGLSIAKWIVEQFSGSIRAESTLGQGTTFEVCLPRLNTPEQEIVHHD